MPTTKWWVRKGAAKVDVKEPDPATQPEPVSTPKASKAKGEVTAKDA